jgi:hypothetical protein
MRDEMKEGNSQEISIGIARSACGDRTWSPARTGENVRNH